MNLSVFIFLFLSNSYCILCGRIPRIARHPSDKTWEINSLDNRLSCIVEGESIKKIVWSKNNILLNIESLSPRIIQKFKRLTNSEVLSTLEFAKVKRSDEGSYTCGIIYTSSNNDTLSLESKAAHITVTGNGAPVFVDTPKNITVKLHESLHMPCHAKGPPPIETITWEYFMYFKTVLVHQNKLVTNPTLKGFYLSSLPDATLAAEKNVTSYNMKCNARNSLGMIESPVVTVTILQPISRPVITSAHSSVQSASLNWSQCDGATLYQVKLVTYDKPNVVRYFNVSGLTLSLNVTGLHWDTRYTVFVRSLNDNESSEWSKPFHFKTKEGLPIQAPLNVRSEYNESFETILWNALHEDQVKGRLMGYKIQFVSHTHKMIYNTTSNFVVVNDLDGLIPNTTYNVSVCAYTLPGNGPFSVVLQIKVTNYHILRQPQITRIIRDSESAIVYFNSGSKKSSIKNCSATVFVYLELVMYWNKFTTTTSNTSVIKIYGLKPFTSYNITVFCTNKYGNSQPSRITNFETLASAPTYRPGELSITNLNDSALDIKWKVRNYNNYTYYKLLLTPPISSRKRIYCNTTFTNISIAIEPCTNYTVLAQACTAGGCGPVSEPVLYNFNETSSNAQRCFSLSSPLDEKSTDLTNKIAYIVGTVLLTCLIVVTVIVVYKKLRHKKDIRSEYSLTSVSRYRQCQGNGDTLRSVNAYMTMSGQGSVSEVTLLREKLSNVLIEPETLFIGKVLGEGEFGFVYKGRLAQDNRNRDIEAMKPVAIKSIKMENTSFSEKEQFIDEGLRMKELNHPNVMTLIGICLSTTNGCSSSSSAGVSPLVVLPYMSNGDLRTYLFNCRMSGSTKDYTIAKLLKFGLDIAKGMEYLASKNFVHRDLAARNCMLDQNLNVVVSDFGLSRKLYSESYYRQTQITRLPVKWMAMESLSDYIYTSTSDVWSFGVTLWEILTFCRLPYPGVANHEVYQLLRGGTRLPKPAHCPAEVWHRVVYPCWHAQVKGRITFDQLVYHLNNYVTSPTDEISQPITDEFGSLSPTAEYEEPIQPSTSNYNLAEDNNSIDTAKSLSSPLLLEEEDYSDTSSIVDL